MNLARVVTISSNATNIVIEPSRNTGIFKIGTTNIGVDITGTSLLGKVIQHARRHREKEKERTIHHCTWGGYPSKRGEWCTPTCRHFHFPLYEHQKGRGKILVEDDTHVNIRNTVVRADVLCCRQIASRERQPGENTRKWLQMCQRTWCNSS